MDSDDCQAVVQVLAKGPLLHEAFEVTVDNVAPTATLGNDGPLVEGSSANVSFSGQSDASKADTTAGLRYAFHCDGSPFATPEGPFAGGPRGATCRSASS